LPTSYSALQIPTERQVEKSFSAGCRKEQAGSLCSPEANRLRGCPLRPE
jgi:hypothetical protein